MTKLLATATELPLRPAGSGAARSHSDTWWSQRTPAWAWCFYFYPHVSRESRGGALSFTFMNSHTRVHTGRWPAQPPSAAGRGWCQSGLWGVHRERRCCALHREPLDLFDLIGCLERDLNPSLQGLYSPLWLRVVICTALLPHDWLTGSVSRCTGVPDRSHWLEDDSPPGKLSLVGGESARETVLRPSADSLCSLSEVV